MLELSPQNIDLIRREISDHGIMFSHLADDLTDHICCDVESEMIKGLSFHDAYKVVKAKIGNHRLNEIQAETLYAVDTKYRKMKNTMKISGIAGTILFGFASLFKIMHWPLAGVLMTLGALTLGFVFMPSLLSVLWKETHSSKKLFLFISAFFTALFFITGILFKVQHWPGAGIVITLAGVSAVLFFIPALLFRTFKYSESKVKRPVHVLGAIGTMLYITGFLFKMQHWPLSGAFLICGLIILFIIVFPWLTFITWKNEEYIRSEFIYMVSGSLAIMIPASLTVTNIGRNFEAGYFTNMEQQKALSDFLNENNKAFLDEYRDSVSFGELQQIHSRTNNLISLINTIEAKMIAEAEGDPGNPLQNPPQVIQTENGQNIVYGELSNPFHTRPAEDFLLTGTDQRSNLDSALNNYRKYLSEVINDKNIMDPGKIIDISAFLPEQAGGRRKISMMTGLHSLALLRNILFTIEGSALKTVAGRK